MSTCRGCGGIVGRDCFNPSECEWISHDMERRAAQQYAEQQCADQYLDRITELERQNAELRQQLAAQSEDSKRLDWLEQHDGRFYNTDKISSVVGSGFSSDGYKTRTQSLRSAIDAALAQSSEGKKP